MSVGKTNGKFLCFNGSCGASGELTELVKSIKRTNEFQTARLIAKAKEDNPTDFTTLLTKALEPVDFKEWQYASTIPAMEERLFENEKAYDYMVKTRGFEESVLREYHVGYNAKRDLICVPMYTEKGLCVGVVGRPVQKGKVSFKNSPGLPQSKTLWNIHNAKRTGDVVIVCEATFDAMKIVQAGYPNVVACLGGNFSEYHAQQLRKYFNTVIIMTDFDDSEKYKYRDCRKCFKRGLKECIGHNPGRATGEKIADLMTGKSVKWAAYDHKLIYPNGAKDPDEAGTDAIRQCVQNAVTNFEYQQWGIAS